MTRMRTIIVICLVTFAASAVRGDATAMWRSLIFPGMGQIGSGHVAKGLGFFAAEAVLFNLAFTELSKMSAYDKETRYLQVSYQMAGTYEERQAEYAKWQDSYDNRSRSLNMALIYGGVAVLAWGLNVVDAALFSHNEVDGFSRAINEMKKTTFVTDGEEYRLSYRTEF